MKKSTTESFEKTQEIGQNFASEILTQKPKTLRHGSWQAAVVLGLQGDLGAGKTTFLQGFAKGLGIKESVLSPTFIVMKRFPLKTIFFKNFYHFDCYRLNNYQEILLLGFAQIISDPKNIVAIEWPEKIKKAMPKNIITIKFKHLKENKRELTIEN